MFWNAWKRPASRPKSRSRKLLTFIIVGGGYSGVETAGQIWDLLRDVQRLYPRINPKEFRLILVNSGAYLLPQIGEELGKYCELQLRKRGIEVRLNVRVTAITPERDYLEIRRRRKRTKAQGEAKRPLRSTLG